jgi:hypothetical protein
MKVSSIGRVGGAGGRPTIRGGIVSPTRVHIAVAIISTPDNHFFAGPNCRVVPSARRRVGNAGSGPAIRARSIPAASVQPVASTIERIPTPDDHFATCPDCCVTSPGDGRIGGAGGDPAIRSGIISRASVQLVVVVSTPDNHFTASPNCRVGEACRGRVGNGESCPAIGGGIISPTGVQVTAIRDAAATPNDHFSAGPDCCVTVSSGWPGARGSPTISGRIVSTAAVQSVVRIQATPHNHFAAGPHCCVTSAGKGRVGRARGSPVVIGARRSRFGNVWKSVSPIS